MDNAAWQYLLGFESVDIVRDWHSSIFGRTLNTRRVNEITASAKQAREYFRNAKNSTNLVKPLLIFYGVASLARSTLLLLKPESGEQSLVQGHGLGAVDWSATLSGELSTALKALGNLKVRISTGLFNDFVSQTSNTMAIHAYSSSVDWRISYKQPPLGTELTPGALLLCVPDLGQALSNSKLIPHFASVNEISYSSADGFAANVVQGQFSSFQEFYIFHGYKVLQNEDFSKIACSNSIFENSPPQFAHTYVRKDFGSIPGLYITKPILPEVRFSQLAITYMIAYFLGMLTRYFPTHWIALHSSTTGDGLWPVIHAAQEYAESSFPELIVGLTQDVLSQSRRGG